MKRISVGLIALASAFFLAGLPALAQGGRPGGRPGGAGSHPGPEGMGQNRPSEPGRPSTAGPSSSGAHATSSTASSRKSVSDLLTQNTKLSSNLQDLLPPGTDLQTASSGFKNLGQFVAAVHVSKNLDIPFDDLKAKLTGPDSVSLGKAIQQLDPKADAKAEAKKANSQAKQDLKDSRS